MSPIFVRPVREQLEHDRLIRFLQAKYKRKLDVAINVGDERVAPVKIGAGTFFPDLVLTDGKKLAGLVEVETGESVNNLEAMAQWVHFSRARVPFHLYVPVPGYDAARRLVRQPTGEAVAKSGRIGRRIDGFDLVRMFHDARRPRYREAVPREAAPAAKPREAAKPARPAKAAKPPSPPKAEGRRRPKPSRPSAKPAKAAAKPGRARGNVGRAFHPTDARQARVRAYLRHARRSARHGPPRTRVLYLFRSPSAT